jgi:hypothetical protein
MNCVFLAAAAAAGFLLWFLASELTELNAAKKTREQRIKDFIESSLALLSEWDSDLLRDPRLKFM